jgi:hypothetical protein
MVSVIGDVDLVRGGTEPYLAVRLRALEAKIASSRLTPSRMESEKWALRIVVGTSDLHSYRTGDGPRHFDHREAEHANDVFAITQVLDLPGSPPHLARLPALL